MSRVLTFDMLTDGQKHAFDVLMKRIEQKKHTTVRGAAGTGKTAMMKFIVQEMVRRGVTGVVLATPTHQAKKVLSKAVGRQAFTLHALLRLNPTNYEDTQVFEQKDTPKLDDVQIIIVDEASMVDKKLFDILMKSINGRIVVIAVGDPHQLRPVDPSGATSISPFFTDEKFQNVELTEIKRSNAPIIDVATAVRNGKWVFEKQCDNEGVFHSSTLPEFMTRYFEAVKTPEDLLENRILAYTNKSVEKLNEIVRKRVYNTDEPVIVDEILVTQEPLIEYLRDERGKKIPNVIFNNGEMIRVKEVIPREFTLRCTGVDPQPVLGYTLKVESVDDDEDKEILNQKVGLDAVGITTDKPDLVEINILTEQRQKNIFSIYLNTVAGQYREMKKENPKFKPDWDSFWTMKRMFLNVKALPACTIHKSQGISVDRVFLYTPCMCTDNVDFELAMQLLYVGVTRARYRVDYI